MATRIVHREGQLRCFATPGSGSPTMNDRTTPLRETAGTRYFCGLMEAKPLLVALVPLLAIVGCTKEAPPAPKDKTPAPSATAAAPKASAAQGTDGSGDGSGSSIANARALRKGTPATFTLTCSATVFTGPFRFTKDPEKLLIEAKAKNASPSQICVGGEWLDGSGKVIGPSGIGCADGKGSAEGKPELEYSPGNGGNGTNPVYLALKFGEPKPEGCPSIDVTLLLP